MTEELRIRYSNRYPFSGKVFCSKCGSVFRRVKWGGKPKYQKHVWLCRKHEREGDKTKDVAGTGKERTHTDGRKKPSSRTDNVSGDNKISNLEAVKKSKTSVNKGCNMKAIDEEKLKQAFVRTANKIIAEDKVFIKKMMKNIESVIEDNTIANELDDRITEIRQQLTNLVKLNTKGAVDAEIYNDEYQKVALEMDKLREKRAEISKRELEVRDGIKRVKEIEKIIRDSEVLEEFDEELFKVLVEKVVVVSLVEVEFVLGSGVVVRELV